MTTRSSIQWFPLSLIFGTPCDFPQFCVFPSSLLFFLFCSLSDVILAFGHNSYCPTLVSCYIIFPVWLVMGLVVKRIKFDSLFFQCVYLFGSHSVVQYPLPTGISMDDVAWSGIDLGLISRNSIYYTNCVRFFFRRVHLPHPSFCTNNNSEVLFFGWFRSISLYAYLQNQFHHV